MNFFDLQAKNIVDHYYHSETDLRIEIENALLDARAKALKDAAFEVNNPDYLLSEATRNKLQDNILALLNKGL